MLEAIAAAAGLPAVGSESLERDETLAAQRALGRAVRLAWRTRTRRGFFLRAEDFLGFAKRIAQLRAEMLARVAEVEAEFADASASSSRASCRAASTSSTSPRRRSPHRASSPSWR